MLRDRGAIVKAEVGAAKGAEKIQLEADANRQCDVIESASFWSGLKNVIGDIEPICFGTNINQKDSTRPDEVLLTIAGLYLHFKDHPEREVAGQMCARLEKRWADADQLMFLIALILNPFEMVSRFGPLAQLDHFKCHNMVMEVRDMFLSK